MAGILLKFSNKPIQFISHVNFLIYLKKDNLYPPLNTRVIHAIIDGETIIFSNKLTILLERMEIERWK